jgi:hypothetical protein
MGTCLNYRREEHVCNSKIMIVHDQIATITSTYWLFVADK